MMASTRRAAMEKAQYLIDQRKKGLDAEGAKVLLCDFLKRFLDYYKTEGGVARRTWQEDATNCSLLRIADYPRRRL
jgi:hypothetical protein